MENGRPGTTIPKAGSDGRPFRAVLDEATSLQEAIANIQQTTRNYAKRQATWFKRETAFVNISVSPLDSSPEVAEKIRRIFGLKKQ